MANQRQLSVLPWTTSIRGVACLVVIVWHSLLTVVPEGSVVSPREHLVILPLGLVAREAVQVFVVLSGFLIGRHWIGGFGRDAIGPKSRRYFLRRSLRILPPYWAALTLTVLLMAFAGLAEPQGTHWDTGLPFTLERTVVDYLLLSDLLTQVPLSHQIWTVPVEYHLYLLAPLIIFLRGPSVNLLAAAGTLAICFLLPAYQAPFFLFAFCMAFWAGVTRQSMTEGSRGTVLRVLAPAMAIALLVAAVGYLFSPLPEGFDKYFVADALTTVVLVPWLLFRDLSGRRTVLVKVLELRPLHYLGVASFSIYLVHGFVVELSWRHLVRPLGLDGRLAPILVLATVGLALSLLVGHLFYLTIERRSEGWSRRAGRVSWTAAKEPATVSGGTR